MDRPPLLKCPSEPRELRCRACGYSLAGLPCDDGGEIDCPECGLRDVPFKGPDRPWPEFWLFTLAIGGPPALGMALALFTGPPALGAGWIGSLLALIAMLAYCEEFKDGTPRPTSPKLIAFFLTLNIAAPVLILLGAAMIATVLRT